MADNETVKEALLIKVEAQANSNKFYRVTLHADGTLVKQWGRVGAAGQSSRESTGESGFYKAIDSKKKRGYVETELVSTKTGPVKSGLDNSRLEKIAAVALAGDKDSKMVADLISRISKLNAHEILEASGGKITVDASGVVSTPVGIVSLESIRKARTILNQLAAQRTIDTNLLNQYLTYVPQRVPGKAGWHQEFLTEVTTTAAQVRLLDQLEASVDWYKNQEALAKADQDGKDGLDEDYSGFFRYQVREATPAEFKRIVKKYNDDKNLAHTSAALKPVRAFVLDSNNPEDARRWEEAKEAYGNVQELWHGTKAANLLSIFQKGLFVPPTSGTSIQVVGRMFGDGIYQSNQSSKALAYATGYWHGGRQSNYFMFLTESTLR